MRAWLSLLLVVAVACGGDDAGPACEPMPIAQPAREHLACEAEFRIQAARPLDAALPGAFTVKIIVDRQDGDRTYFLDTNAYPLHSRFAIEHLGFPPGLPFVDQYFSPSRRFVLGSIT